MTHLITILALGGLCAGWVGVQVLAKKMGTKNHFDDLKEGCGSCKCGGSGSCRT